MTTAASAVLFGAALRALIMACVLWAGLRLLRVRNVWVQKAAWSVVLVAGFAMPALIASPWWPGWAAVQVPAISWSEALFAQLHANTAKPPLQPTEQLPAPNSAPPAALEIRHARARVLRNEDLASLPGDGDESATIAPSNIEPVAVSPVSAAAPMADGASKAQPLSAQLISTAWLLYLAVSVALLFRLLFGVAAAIRLWVRSEPVNANAGCGFNPQIPVRASPLISSPVNIGSGIILPADYAEWDAETLRVVLAHEGAHVEQRDFYLQLAAGVYAAINWFSPLGWWLKRKLSELSEAISDRAGLEESASGPAYAQLLLEFAARPRPTLIGVPMAHKGNLSERIDGLLNDAHFKQAFGGTRRALIGAVVVPLILVAMTATVRVKAASAVAQSDSMPTSSPAQPAVTVQSNPQPAQVGNSRAGQTAPSTTSDDQSPVPSPSPAPAPAPPESASADQNQVPSPAPPVPAANDSQDSAPAVPPMPPIPDVHVDVHVPPMPPMPAFDARVYVESGCRGSGNSYAIVGEPGTQTEYCGNWGPDGSTEVDKARTNAHAPFVLIRREGKLYIVDDPATVSQLQAMEQARESLRAQMRAFGDQMRAKGEADREAPRAARKTAENIPTPDLSKELAELDASVASLKAKQGATVSREQLQEIQHEVSELQRRVIQAEIGASLNINMNGEMAQFGKEQAEFGKQMGQLGNTMGEQGEKMRAIIDESLKDGKARPVN